MEIRNLEFSNDHVNIRGRSKTRNFELQNLRIKKMSLE
jgi:hypothetical protein